MNCDVLRRLLDLLEVYLRDKETDREIEKIKDIINTRQDIPGCAEALCRSLSLAFTLPVNIMLWNRVVEACQKVLSLDLDQEKVLDAVDEWLHYASVDRINTHIIQSLLLWQSHDPQSAIRWAVEAQKMSACLNQRAQMSWSQSMIAIFYIERGNYLYMKGRLQDAAINYERAIPLWPEMTTPWINLATLRIEQKRLSDAIAICNQALKIYNREWSLWIIMAQIYSLQGKLEIAENELQKAVALNNTSAALYNALGVVQSGLGKTCCAISSYNRAISLKPEEAAIWNNLGLELEKLGLYIDAITAFRKAFTLNPNILKITINLIAILLKVGEYQNASAELQRCITNEVHKANWKSIRGARDFGLFVESRLLTHYNLVAGKDYLSTPPGSGKHVVDYYLSIVQQLLIDSLKGRELEGSDVITNLLYIGKLWCLYAEKLSQKGLSKQFVREQLYKIEQMVRAILPKEVQASGFASSWPELKARMGATSAEEFAREMLRQEPTWLASVAEGQKRGEVEDLQWRLQGNLWIHVFEHQNKQEHGHLERVHYYMELLKGHTMLHKLANPQIIVKTGDHQRWNRYVDSLPVKIDQTAIVDLETCTALLPENAVALSFYFLHRELLPNLLLVIVLKQGQLPSIRIVEDMERLKKFQNAAMRLKQIHHLVAWRPKVPDVGRIFCEISGEKKGLKGRELIDAVTKGEKKQLRLAYEAILDGLLDIEELRGKDLYISPSPEMYDIPFGLLLRDDEFLNGIIKSITVVPIFSLRQFRYKNYFTEGDGLVLCLDGCWQDEARRRASKLSDKWCKKATNWKVESELSNFVGNTREKYNEWINAIEGIGKLHMIGHHDALQWSNSTIQEPNLGQFARYLYDAPKKLSANMLSLEACWGGTWSAPEDLMGLFVSFLASGVSHVIASPYSLVPSATSGKLFDYLYECDLQTSNDHTGLQIARALRNAAEAIRSGALNSDDVIPTLWGALQLYGVA